MLLLKTEASTSCRVCQQFYFINRLTDASILVSGSDDAMHKNLEACAWRGQVGVAMATSLKA
ncbi:hypothetical protein D3088_08020 [Escherichia coli]|nr:hypothetical protein [Escherichia coli]EFN9337662.1 hypothetical protein [Escherichia coli]